MVALASGALQFFYGAIGGGKLIKFIPYPVVSGYLSGVGVLIFASQIPSFLGLSPSTGLMAGLSMPEHWKWQGIAVGLTTVAGILAAPKLTKAVPAPIVGLAAGMLTYFGLGLGFPELLSQSGNKLVLGPVGGGIGAVWPHLADQWKSIGAIEPSDWKLLIVPALTLSALLIHRHAQDVRDSGYADALAPRFQPHTHRAGHRERRFRLDRRNAGRGNDGRDDCEHEQRRPDAALRSVRGLLCAAGLSVVRQSGRLASAGGAGGRADGRRVQDV